MNKTTPTLIMINSSSNNCYHLLNIKKITTELLIEWIWQRELSIANDLIDLDCRMQLMLQLNLQQSDPISKEDHLEVVSVEFCLLQIIGKINFHL